MDRDARSTFNVTSSTMEETEFQLQAGALTLWLQVPSKLAWTEILFKTALRELIPRSLQMLPHNGDDMSHKPAGYPSGQSRCPNILGVSEYIGN